MSEDRVPFEQLCAAVLETSRALVAVGMPGSLRLLSPDARHVSVEGTAVPPVLDLLVHPDDREEFDARLHEALRPGDDEAFTVRVLRSDDVYRTYEATLSDRRGDPRVGGLVLQAWDVTRRQETYERAALYDGLTGLPNRLLLEDRLRRGLRGLGRRPGLLALVFVDLDGFKAVNDTLGHLGGDMALQQAAQRLVSGIRPEDTPARWGGDEFAVLCEDLADRSTALAVGERIRLALGQPLPVGDTQVRLRASVGVATCEDAETPVAALWEAADRAMYAAKSGGGARTQVA